MKSLLGGEHEGDGLTRPLAGMLAHTSILSHARFHRDTERCLLDRLGLRLG